MARLEVEVVEVSKQGIHIRHSGRSIPWLARGLGVSALRDLSPGTIVVAEVDVFDGDISQVYEVIGNWINIDEAIEIASKGDWPKLLQRLRLRHVDRDRNLRVFRVRALLELERIEEATRELIEVLLMRIPTRSNPPVLKISELFAAFSPDAAEQLIPAIVEAVRSGHLPLDGEDTHRTMSLIPERFWSDGYLCHRSRIETSPRLLRELERRVAASPESERLSRALEKAKRPQAEPPESRAHPIYRSASGAVKPSIPRGPAHLGGPMPELTAADCKLLMRWSLDRILIEFEPNQAESTAIERLKTSGYQFLNEVRELRVGPNTQMFELIEHIVAAQLIGGGAVARRTKRAVRCAAIMMASIGKGAAFVEELDREIMRIEIAGMLQRAQKPVPASFEVLARAADERGKPAAWLLKSDRYLFLAKVRKSWIYEEGERDEVIASVPDRWFDQIISSSSSS